MLEKIITKMKVTVTCSFIVEKKYLSAFEIVDCFTNYG